MNQSMDPEKEYGLDQAQHQKFTDKKYLELFFDYFSSINYDEILTKEVYDTLRCLSLEIIPICDSSDGVTLEVIRRMVDLFNEYDDRRNDPTREGSFIELMNNLMGQYERLENEVITKKGKYE